jgi:C4-dicarboxylate-specific signal transduction histidine kinase
MSEPELRLSRQVYRLRIFGLGLGFLCIAAVFYERGASPLAWTVLAAHGFVWPHVAWHLARTSADPHAAERINLLVDSAMGGIYVALMQARREAIAISPLIKEVLALLDHELRLNGVETILQLRDDLPPVFVDRIEIEQVLVNLIRNAIEAMGSAATAVRRLTIATEPMPRDVGVTVTDTGGGIAPAILARLFHPFQTTKSAGLGLGLSICQSLVEANGGRVSAGPHPADGAAFFFELPFARTDHA